MRYVTIPHLRSEDIQAEVRQPRDEPALHRPPQRQVLHHSPGTVGSSGLGVEPWVRTICLFSSHSLEAMPVVVWESTQFELDIFGGTGKGSKEHFCAAWSKEWVGGWKGLLRFPIFSFFLSRTTDSLWTATRCHRTGRSFSSTPMTTPTRASSTTMPGSPNSRFF